MKGRLTILSAALAGVVGIAVYVPLAVPRDALKAQLELVLADVFGTPVAVGELDLRVFPDTILTARRLRVVDPLRRPDLEVRAVELDVDFWRIWDAELTISRLHIDGLRAEAGGLFDFIQRVTAPSEESSALGVLLPHLSASPVALRTPSGRWQGPFRVLADFDREGDLAVLKVQRLDGRASLRLDSDGDGTKAFLEARDWRPPEGPALHFDELEASGRLQDDRLVLDRIYGRAYGGTLSASGVVDWRDQWQVQLDSKVRWLALGPVMSVLGDPGLSGRLDWDGSLQLEAQEAAALFEAPEMRGHFRLRRGALVTGEGGSTLGFKRISGHLTRGTELVEYSDLRIEPADGLSRPIGPLRVLLHRGEGGELRRVEAAREDGTAEVALTRGTDGWDVRADAREWEMPVSGAPHLNRLSLTGQLMHSRLRVRSLDARLYGGRVRGRGAVSWGKRWALDLRGRVTNVRLEPLLSAFESSGLAGRLYVTGRYQARGESPSALLQRPIFDGDVLIREGAIQKADLKRAARSIGGEAVVGGETQFDELSTRVAARGGNVRLTKLRIAASGLEARGDLLIDDSQALDGELDVGVHRLSKLVGMPIRVRGSVEAPSLRPTDEAIAGAVAGTALLGPGLGTAVGVKAGQFVKSLGDFISRRLKRKGDVREGTTGDQGAGFEGWAERYVD